MLSSCLLPFWLYCVAVTQMNQEVFLSVLSATVCKQS